MSSIQAYKAHKQEGTIAATTLVSKVHKQGASSNSQASLHQLAGFFSIFCNLELISISYNYHAATDVGMLSLGIRRCPLFVHLAYQCCCCYSSFLFVCFVGLYAGHPYIQLISFEIFLLSFCALFKNNNNYSYPRT